MILMRINWLLNFASTKAPEAQEDPCRGNHHHPGHDAGGSGQPVRGHRDDGADDRQDRDEDHEYDAGARELHGKRIVP